MKLNLLSIFIIIFSIIILPMQLLARCAVCYTNGLSGASIALIVIIISAIILFFGNKILQKILNKY